MVEIYPKKTAHRLCPRIHLRADPRQPPREFSSRSPSEQVVCHQTVITPNGFSARRPLPLPLGIGFMTIAALSMATDAARSRLRVARVACGPHATPRTGLPPGARSACDRTSGFPKACGWRSINPTRPQSEQPGGAGWVEALSPRNAFFCWAQL
jgi:hypothetical protein